MPSVRNREQKEVIPMKKNTIITISRQYGSGGRELSRILADKMGVKRYDRKVVAMAAEQVGAGDPLEEIISRSYNVSENCLGNLGDAAFDRVPSYNQLYIEQGRIIRAIADEGNGAVFLGRCADVILDGMPEVYSFFICADDAFRAKRAQTHYGGMSLKQLNEIEKARKNYYSFYTGRTWGDPQNYHLTINTSHISLEKAAMLILSYIEFCQGE